MSLEAQLSFICTDCNKTVQCDRPSLDKYIRRNVNVGTIWAFSAPFCRDCLILRGDWKE